MRKIAWLAGSLLLVQQAMAGELPVKLTDVDEWKAVYGRVEARTTVLARARIGGTLTGLMVSEGDTVTEGQVVAMVSDDKLAFRIKGADAQLQALGSQLENAIIERDRGLKLLQSGVSTKQRQDALQTQVSVLTNQIAEAGAQRQVLLQQGEEGAVVAPLAGKVLTVPLTKGSVVMPGEAVASVAGGGFFLRLSIPERHAAMLHEGAALEIETADGAAQGKLAKIYPDITNGRVTADVEVPNLSSRFVNARVLVRVPVSKRQALMVPQASVETRSGIDFVSVQVNGAPVAHVVVAGERIGDQVEILSGLAVDDVILTP